MKRFPSWGVGWHSCMVHSREGSCPHCGWESDIMRVKEMMPYMVGFDNGGPPKRGFLGAFIFECPTCFEKFWFHAEKNTVEYLATFHDAWPK